MARPLRVEYENACYHVMNRGNRGLSVFSTTSDNQLFLNALQEYSEIFQVSIRAFCLMGNHFHLYICTPNANLSRFMQALLTSFTLSKNKRDGERGHLFQGRFKALLVEDAVYSAEVSRYIHLNPVRTKLYQDQEFIVRQEVLRSYTWSSYTAVAGLKPCPGWIDRASLLQRFPGKLSIKQEAYTRYVEEGLVHEIIDPFEASVAGAILGSSDFIARIRREFTTFYDNVKQRHERVQEQRVACWIDLDELVDSVAQQFECPQDEVRKKGQRSNVARQIALYSAAHFCRGRYTLSQIATHFGLSPGGLSSARTAFQRRLDKDRTLKKGYDQLCKTLNMIS